MNFTSYFKYTTMSLLVLQTRLLRLLSHTTRGSPHRSTSSHSDFPPTYLGLITCTCHQLHTHTLSHKRLCSLHRWWSWFATVITTERLSPVYSAYLCITRTVTSITIPAACLDLLACSSTRPACRLPRPSARLLTCVLYCLLLLINCRWIIKLLTRHN